MTIPTPHDFSFDQTVIAHGWRALLPFTWSEEAQSLEYVYAHSSGTVCIIKMSAPEGALTVYCEIEDEEVQVAVRQMLQLDISLDNFYAYCKQHQKLAGIPVLKQGRLLVSPSIFEDVVKVICKD